LHEEARDDGAVAEVAGVFDLGQEGESEDGRDRLHHAVDCNSKEVKSKESRGRLIHNKNKCINNTKYIRDSQFKKNNNICVNPTERLCNEGIAVFKNQRHQIKTSTMRRKLLQKHLN